jgi:hypothetical protein
MALDSKDPTVHAVQYLFAAVTISFICCVALVTYRLHFSPLSGFPGPKIAAATGYYEFYHDYFRNGQYFKVIKSLHDKYGAYNIPPITQHAGN